MTALDRLAVAGRGTRGVRGGRTGRIRGTLPFLGPAFVAGIAYVDPGNVATNVAAGSRFGYGLLWVVLAANAVAALMQALSAKLGLATGRCLAEVNRDRYRPGGVLVLWAQAEIMAIATDLAEVVGGALALQLLVGLPLPVGAVVTALAAYALLGLRNRGHRPFEVMVAGLFLVIAGGFVYDALAAHPHPSSVATGLAPILPGTGAAVLATAIVGATVMPHAVYLHSALTRRRTPPGAEISSRQALRFQRIDITVAMGSAGLVNAAMLVGAAAVATAAATGGDSIEQFHHSLLRTVGAGGAFTFIVALLASGLASSGVGTLAGEVIMSGYLHRHLPRVLRRLITLAPAVALLVCGIPATTALVASQVVLGLGVPIALTLLILATADRKLMGPMVNRTATTMVATVCAGAVAVVDLVSLCSAFR